MNIRYFRGIVNRARTSRGEQGVSLIEILIALTLLGLVAVVFLGGLETTLIAAMVNRGRVTAEGLAKSQVEYVKNYEYDDENDPPVYDTDPDLTVPAGHTISTSAEIIDPLGEGSGDHGIQKITVTVTYGNFSGDEKTLTIIDYKVDR